MNIALVLVAALPLSSALMAGILFCYAWPDRRRPAGFPVLALLASAGIWAFFYALEILVPQFPLKVVMAQCQYLGIVFVAPSWCLAVSRLTGNTGSLTPPRMAFLLIIPLLTCGAAITNSLHGLLWREITLFAGPVPLLQFRYGPIFWINNQYAWLLLILGTVLLLRGAWSQYRFLTPPGALMILTILAPWVANALYILKLGPIPNLDLTPCAFVISAVVLFLGITRLNLTRVVPIAREYILENLSEALYVLDAEGRLLDTNLAGAQLLGIKKSAIVGEPATTVFRIFPALLELARATGDCESEVILNVGQGKAYSASLHSLPTPEGAPSCRIVSCTDVSERLRNDQALRQSEARYRGYF